jgi:hypothetical protein
MPKKLLCDVSDWNIILGVFKAALTLSPAGTLDVVEMFAGVAGGMHLTDQIATADIEC